MLDNEKIFDEFLEAVYENSSDAIIVFSFDKKVLYCNSHARSLFEEKKSRFDFDALFSNYFPAINFSEFLCFSKYEKVKIIQKEIFLDKTQMLVKFISSNEKNNFKIFVIFKNFEYVKNENSTRDFLANVSHELKTPLTNIKTHVETLLNSVVLSETNEHFLKIASSETVRMEKIVNDLLELSKFDSKKNQLNLENFCLKNLILEVINKLKIESQSKGIVIEYFESTKIPTIRADKDKIERALQNIISNSLKFTLSGGKIAVYSGFLFNEFYVKIRDNGLGIPKKDLPHIFDRFYRVDKGRSREMGGTGLGLSIAREIVNAHEGSIEVISEFGNFTEFVIKIPLVI